MMLAKEKASHHVSLQCSKNTVLVMAWGFRLTEKIAQDTKIFFVFSAIRRKTNRTAFTTELLTIMAFPLFISWLLLLYYFYSRFLSCKTFFPVSEEESSHWEVFVKLTDYSKSDTFANFISFSTLLLPAKFVSEFLRFRTVSLPFLISFFLKNFLLPCDMFQRFFNLCPKRGWRKFN